ncbi:unnamed protein product [Sphagnum jensenii]|uniref:Uncharacterized protein n=1 Tax=Sphagnum jensenii TaxID=128206 RepID=A0ABP1ALK0_9BRYO
MFVSTSTKNTATPSTDEAKVTTTEPSPASNNNDLFNCNSNLNSNVGLCLDKWLQQAQPTAAADICHAKPVTAVTGTYSATSTDPAATLVASGGEPATTATTTTAASSPTAR